MATAGATQPTLAPRSEPRAKTVRDIHPLYEKHAQPRFRSWGKAHAVHFEHHLMPFFGAMAISDIDHAKADEYVRKRQGEKTIVGDRDVAQRTINAELKTMAAMFHWAVRQRHIPYNPMSGYEYLPEAENPTQPVTEEDLALLLHHLDHPNLGPMITLAWETGMRRDEWRCLRWTEVDLSDEVRLIKLPKERTKTQTARDVVLSDLAVDVLRSTPKLPGSQWVFPSLNDTSQPVPKSTLNGWWVATCKAAGIKRKLHGLRHGMGREAALKKGVPLRGLMDQLGHTDPAVHEEYTRMQKEYYEPVREALNRAGPKRAEIVALLPQLKKGAGK